MQVRVVFHDNVKDIVGCQVETLHLDDSATAASLLSRLASSYPSCMSHVGSFEMGRAGMKINQDAFLADGDIIDISMSERRTA